MKKLFIVLLACLSLTACGYKDATAYHVEIVAQPTQHGKIFCSQKNNNCCAGCSNYNELNTYLDKYNIIALNCTDLTQDSYYPHYHYCVIYTEK